MAATTRGKGQKQRGGGKKGPGNSKKTTTSTKKKRTRSPSPENHSDSDQSTTAKSPRLAEMEKAKQAEAAARLAELEAKVEKQQALIEQKDKLLSRAADNIEKNAGKKGVPIAKALRLDIKTYVKDHAWRGIKFLQNEEQEKAFATAYMDHTNNDEYKDRKNRAFFLRNFAQACTKALNEQRQKVQSGIQKAWKKFYQDNGQVGPDFDLLKRVVTRDFTDEEIVLAQKDDQGKFIGTDTFNFTDEQKEVFCWWVDTVLPIAAGHKNGFDKNIRHYSPISDAYLDQKNTMLAIPPSTEAYALACIENSMDRWKKSEEWYDARGKKRPIELKIKNKPKPDKTPQEFAELENQGIVWAEDGFQSKWSVCDNKGEKRFQGWTPAGHKAYKKYKKACKEGRYDLVDGNYVPKEKSYAWEMMVLDIIRTENAVKAKKPAAKAPENPPDAGDDSDACSEISFELNM